MSEYNAYEQGDRVRILATGTVASVLLKEERGVYEPLRQSGDLYWLIWDGSNAAAFLYATYQFEPIEDKGK